MACGPRSVVHERPLQPLRRRHLPRPRHSSGWHAGRARAGSNPEGEAELTPAQLAIQDRIRKAKEYKSQDKAETQKSGLSQDAKLESENQSVEALPVVPISLDADQIKDIALDEYNNRLADYGAQLASTQHQALSEALDDLQDQPPEPSGRQGDGTETNSASEQLYKARQLAAEKAKQVNASLFAQINRTSAAPSRDSFSRIPGEDSSNAASDESLQRQEAAISGSASEAASYLRKAMKQGKSEDADLRPEMFTIKKDEEVKARGVDFIASDKAYNPLLEEAYQPKVRTWGMFPRPKDISKAYGGGKTYLPGEAIETQEQESARRDKTSAALLEYRKKMGLFIDPEIETRWNATYTDGIALMQTGELTRAIKLFEEVIANVSSRTKLGGQAQLQRAICLDSMGHNDEAYKIYMTLERHPSPEVQKFTKRMIFSFRAAENLKAHTMSYAIGAKGSEEWDKYFTKLAGQWDSGFVAESEPADLTQATLIAAAIIAVPLLLVAVLILT